MLKKFNLYRNFTRIDWSTITYLLFTVLILAGKVDTSRPMMTFIRMEVGQFANFIAYPFCFAYDYIADFGSVKQIKEEKCTLERRVAALQKEVAQRDMIISKTELIQQVKDFLLSQQVFQAYVIAEFLFRTRSDGALLLARCTNLDNAMHRVPIVKNMVVTDASGVIGKVIEVDNKNSLSLDSVVFIELISDLRFRIAAIASTSNEVGILRGTGNGNLMEFKYFNVPHKLQVGELVTTMGDSLTPKGILIGRIAKIDDDSILVAPLADVQRLGYMAIVTRSKTSS